MQYGSPGASGSASNACASLQRVKMRGSAVAASYRVRSSSTGSELRVHRSAVYEGTVDARTAASAAA